MARNLGTRRNRRKRQNGEACDKNSGEEEVRESKREVGARETQRISIAQAKFNFRRSRDKEKEDRREGEREGWKSFLPLTHARE